MNKNIYLHELKIDQTGEVINVEGTGKIRRRLLDMGVTPGTKIYLRKKAPLGDPLEILIRGYELSLRKAEARLIKVRIIYVSRNKEV